jgi:urate oxidase
MSATAASAVFLSQVRYGKDKVRVFRIVREGNLHHAVEYNVQTLLEGDIETRQVFKGRSEPQFVTRLMIVSLASYTQEDNSVIVATDSSTFDANVSIKYIR